MAVLTETARVDVRAGDINIVVGSLASPGNNDTWTPGLRQIVFVDITANASGQTYGYTVSGGTITFKVSGGTNNLTVMAWGF